MLIDMLLDNLLPLAFAVVPSLYQSRPTSVAKKILDDDDRTGGFTQNLLFALVVVLLSSVAFFVDGLNKPVELVLGFTMTAVHYVMVVGIGGIATINFLFTLVVEHVDKDKRRKMYLGCICGALLIAGHILLLQPFV